MHSTLPPQVSAFFWGDDLSQLSWQAHKKYIVETLLDKGDKPALHWLFSQIDTTELKSLLPTLKLQPKSRNFWQVYLS